MATFTLESEWGTSTVNTYTKYETSTSPAISTLSGGGTSDILASPAISTTAFNGKKIMVGIDVKSGFSDVASTLTIELSHDGVNFTGTFATLSSDITPNVTGLKMALADFTNTDVPYFRIVANASGLTWGNSGTLTFFYLLPPSS
tara:strand:+ start:187 stop:621 length:435 start_codon:yes stop_codon:yes gene_type:complete